MQAPVTISLAQCDAVLGDVARNLDAPIAEMDLPVTVETRTGDTPAARRQRQRHAPPDILLTTPEQLGLLLAHPRAPQMWRVAIGKVPSARSTRFSSGCRAAARSSFARRRTGTPRQGAGAIADRSTTWHWLDDRLETR